MTLESRNWWAAFRAESSRHIEELYPELRVIETDLPSWLTPPRITLMVRQARDIEHWEESPLLHEIMFQRTKPREWSTSVTGKVSFWNEAEGWGLLESAGVGKVKILRPQLQGPGPKHLTIGEPIEFEWEVCGDLLQVIRARRPSASRN